MLGDQEMIVVPVMLESAISRENNATLSLLVIDNIRTSECGRRADYRCRVYKKGTELLDLKMDRDRRDDPLREAHVYNHARKSLPVATLVRKALEALGY